VTAEPERHEGDLGHRGTLPTGAELADRAREVLEAAWRDDPPGGFCVPNADTYPWQWLWDSCFHAVVWAHLGDDRALVELATSLRAQDADGFVPHIRYGRGPYPHEAFWGRRDASAVTQPPMYGHAVAELTRLGFTVPDEVADSARRGLRFLLLRRARSAAGLVELCHPWESGCDDSPRWDSALPRGSTWYEHKGHLLATIERTPGGAPMRNPAFPVASAGFNALVAWNARELLTVAADDELRAGADELADALDTRWDAELLTWLDDGPTARTSGRVRTLDALLPLLLHPRPEAFATLTEPTAFGAECGPRGVHVGEPTFHPTAYWRGPAWPQLTYLLWLAAMSSVNSRTTASALARSMVTGAVRSRFSEYWDAATGDPLGASPQSWSTLAVVVQPQ
jgi:hypothetical protein